MVESTLIVPLVLDDLPRLRLKWGSRYSVEEVAELVRDAPGLSLWAPVTGEYVLAGPWRHREEIVALLEVTSGGLTYQLIDALADVATAQGKQLLVSAQQYERRPPVFYERTGFELLEEIFVYEMVLYTVPPGPSRLRFERVDADDPFTLGELLDLDHEAFDWLWWNSVEEFDEYMSDPRVDVYLGRERDGTPVSYVGVTRLRGWGHLDRLAVSPFYQGQGYGYESLVWAVRVLAARGAHRIALSTQGSNQRSRRLYERFGFRRVPELDYQIYGRWLADPGGT
ncbi:GNAT family N-acetyltransferase [Thermomicrobium sp. CFH 73360]|uniref:GNAT family N-acetyltransferase n=1 Tax=Thermomicrobium sp. CFH 73360 TaxID=2951987 RepID=UPI0020772928|nr:GNAT family N-acetyltransferase [Thermomicrobium sp. CFH 73360]MCM8745729.1 GNAT family N-acetyltransferase [Thermomicrobium sp. CFH 73360]